VRAGVHPTDGSPPPPELAELSRDPGTELASRTQDYGLEPPRLDLEPLQNAKDERGGLATTGLGPSDEIPAAERVPAS